MRANAARAAAAATQDAARRKEAEALIAEQRRRVPVNAGASRRPQAPIAGPMFGALVSQDAFLAYAGFTSASSRIVPPPAVGSLSVASKEDYKAADGPARVPLPQPSPRVGLNPIPDNLAKNVQPHTGTMQNGEVGLEGSRWATSSPVPEVTPPTAAAPPSPIVKPNTLATYGRTVLRECQVQIAKGGATPIRGAARLVKNNPQEDRYFTIELDVGDDNKNVLKEEVHDGDLFTCESTIIKYRARRSVDGTAPKPTATWTIKFQMPFLSWGFYNPVASNPNARNRHTQPDSNTTPESDVEPVATQNPPALPTEKSDSVDKNLECASVEATKHTPASNEVLQADHPSKLLLAPSDADVRSTAVSVGSRRLSISNSSLIFQQEPETRSTSPQRAPSPEWAIMRPIEDSSLAGLLDKYHPGGSDRISSQAWSEMLEAGGLEPLVSLGHDEPETETIHPMIQALLSMDDTQLIQDTLDYLENQSEGSFLHQLSVMVAKENIPPATELTGEEILSIPQYQEATENLVGGRLCHSETFSMMPDIVTIGYTIEKARKILMKAVADRDSQNTSECGAASQFTSVSTRAETGLSISQHCAEPVTLQVFEQPKNVDLDSYSKADGLRITYTAEKLLSLRQHASRFKSELISKEVAQYIIPQPAEVKQANTIGTTKNGIPIVAGRDHFPRTRGNTNNPTFKPATTVGAWQEYSAAESGDSTELSRNIAVNASEVSSVQSREPPSSKLFAEKIPATHNPKTTAAIKKDLVMSPPKPANPVQIQETDMALWGAVLTTVHNNKNEERLRAMSNSKPQTPLVSSRGSKHVPTNSECDRLAKTFEGLHLSNKVKEEPLETKSEQQTSTMKLEPASSTMKIKQESTTMNSEQESPGMKSEQESSTMKLEQESSAMNTEQGCLEMKSEQSAGSDAHSTSTQPPPKDQAESVTFSSLYQRFKDSILTSPLALSSRSKSITSATPAQSVANMIKSETGSIPPTPTLPVAATSLSSDLKVESAVIGSPNVQASAVLVPPPTNLSKAQFSVKAESPKITLSSIPEQLGKVEPAPTTPGPEPNNSTYIKSEHAPAPVHTQSAAPLLVNETTKISETVASVPQVSGKTSLPEGATNKDLKGVLGLKASRWASSAPQPPTRRVPAPQPPAPRAHPAPPITTATPIYPVYPHYPYNPPQTFGNDHAPPPVHVTIASQPPALSTVLIPDPFNPGCFIEVTGISKNGQTAPSMVPMQLMPPTMNPPERQENVPYFQQLSTAEHFTPQAETYRVHTHNKSSGSDFNFNPSNTPFTPNRGRGANAMSPQARTALSPVRQGEDFQAKLQSRLNSSLEGRSPGA